MTGEGFLLVALLILMVGISLFFVSKIKGDREVKRKNKEEEEKEKIRKNVGVSEEDLANKAQDLKDAEQKIEDEHEDKKATQKKFKEEEERKEKEKEAQEKAERIEGLRKRVERLLKAYPGEEFSEKTIAKPLGLNKKEQSDLSALIALVYEEESKKIQGNIRLVLKKGTWYLAFNPKKR